MTLIWALQIMLPLFFFSSDKQTLAELLFLLRSSPNEEKPENLNSKIRERETRGEKKPPQN